MQSCLGHVKYLANTSSKFRAALNLALAPGTEARGVNELGFIGYLLDNKFPAKDAVYAIPFLLRNPHVYYWGEYAQFPARTKLLVDAMLQWDPQGKVFVPLLESHLKKDSDEHNMADGQNMLAAETILKEILSHFQAAPIDPALKGRLTELRKSLYHIDVHSDVRYSPLWNPIDSTQHKIAVGPATKIEHTKAVGLITDAAKGQSEISKRLAELVVYKIMDIYEKSTPAQKAAMLRSLDNVIISNLVEESGGSVDRTDLSLTLSAAALKHELSSLILLHEFRHLYDMTPRSSNKLLAAAQRLYWRIFSLPSVKKMEFAANKETTKALQYFSSPEDQRQILLAVSKQLGLSPKEEEVFLKVDWSKGGMQFLLARATGKALPPDVAKRLEKLEEAFSSLSESELTDFSQKVFSLFTLTHFLPLAEADEARRELIIKALYRERILVNNLARGTAIASAVALTSVLIYSTIMMGF